MEEYLEKLNREAEERKGKYDEIRVEMNKALITDNLDAMRLCFSKFTEVSQRTTI